jgi:hypothetical protein
VRFVFEVCVNHTAEARVLSETMIRLAHGELMSDGHPRSNIPVIEKWRVLGTAMILCDRCRGTIEP